MVGRLLPCLLLLLMSLPAEAGQNCGAKGGKTLTIAQPIVLSGNYDPTAAGNVVVPGVIQVGAPPGLGPCVAWVTLSKGQVGGMVGPGGAHLAYGFSGAFQTAGQEVLNISVDGNGYGPPQSGALVIGAGQHVPAGTYSETRMINVSSVSTLLSQQSLVVSATVVSSCTLPAPATSHLDFSQGISAAHVVAGYAMATSIAGASCTGPSVLRLKGGPMVTTAAAGNLASKIDYKATAVFGGVTAALSTSSQAEAQSSVGAVSGAVSIDVSLVDEGKTLAAGNYNAMLSVVLEPAN
ncbi:hypothetical protein [Hyphomicrobium sp. DY-1]|uniref:hypothetical protein n=1 Tax=Hyphomicrobium sp. DY-1 TaxID=3075650 RepID=UPI0039C19CF0